MALSPVSLFCLCYSQTSIPLTLVCTTRILDAGGDLQRLRRHEQFVSSKRVCPILRCYAVCTDFTVGMWNTGLAWNVFVCRLLTVLQLCKCTFCDL